MSVDAAFRPWRHKRSVHDVSHAWAALRTRREPYALEMLVDRKGRSPSDKSEVYRLHFAAGTPTTVVAKRADRTALQVERFVYAELLPTLPVASLQYFGYAEDPDGTVAWLFLEEADGTPYDETDPDHRAVASRWLGRFHASAGPLARPGLPSRDITRYLSEIQTIRNDIGALDRHRISADGTGIMKRVLAGCDIVEDRWNEIDAFCRTFSECAVHGDFFPKNVRLSRRGGVETVLVMDWELCHWGLPVEEIAGLDVLAYHREVREAWPDVTIDVIRRAESVGRVFRMLAWLVDTTCWLRTNDISWAVADLDSYQQLLHRALKDSNLIDE